MGVIQTNPQTLAANIKVMKSGTLPSKFNCQFTLSVHFTTATDVLLSVKFSFFTSLILISFSPIN